MANSMNGHASFLLAGEQRLRFHGESLMIFPSSDYEIVSEGMEDDKSAFELVHELGDAISTLEVTDVEREATQLEIAEDVFNRLYSEFPELIGKQTSRKERQEQGYISSTLTYGEIHFRPFAANLMKIKDKYGGLSKPGGTFIDIGSGVGKPVFAACLLHDFEQCYGVEILQGLHDVALQVLDEWNSDIKADLPEEKQATSLSFIHGDATLLDWSGADVVFANSTCFDPGLMEKLAIKAEELPKGAFFISTTKPLPSDEFAVLEKVVMEESWGEATVFIQRKTV